MVGGKQRLVYSSLYSAFCDSKCTVKFISSYISKHTEYVYCDNYEIKASDLSVDKRDEFLLVLVMQQFSNFFFVLKYSV